MLPATSNSSGKPSSKGFRTTASSSSLTNSPARHRGLPGPSGPEPQKSLKRVRKGVPRGERQSPQRVHQGVRKESKNAASDSFRTLFSALFYFGDSGAVRGGTPFRTLFGLFWGPGPGRPLCLAGGSQLKFSDQPPSQRIYFLHLGQKVNQLTKET